MIPHLQKTGLLKSVRLLAVALFLLGLLGTHQRARAATRYYVNDDAPAGGNGLSWNTAFRYLQDALTVAVAGDEIWVATGVYYPDESALGGDTNNQDASFNLKSGVAIYGGFAGSETALADRTVSANVTVLSGDIDKDDTTNADGVVIDQAHSGGDNSFHVVRAHAVDATAILDGFTITAGIAVQGSDCARGCGAGLYATAASATLANLNFIGNRANYGGGALLRLDSIPKLTQVNFINNYAIFNGGGLQTQESALPVLKQVQITKNRAGHSGGGLYAYNTIVHLTSVTFTDNEAAGIVSLEEGGGGMASLNTGGTLIDVTFTNNKAAEIGGGLLNQVGDLRLINLVFSGNRANNHGGAIYNHSSSPTLTNVTLSGNRAANGGGILNDNSNPILTNVTLSGNRAGDGGGIYNNNSNPILTNVTFSGNRAARGGGIYNFSSTPLLQNTILWDNLPESVHNIAPTTIIIFYSLVQGLALSGNGNLDGTNEFNNPRFAHPVNCGDDGCTDNPLSTDVDESANDDYGDLHLQSGSPAIDAGNNNADLDGSGTGTTIIADISADAAGQPRISASKSPAAVIDMGAYEAAIFPPAANAGGPYVTNEGSAISPDASASTDDGSIASFGWDCTNDNSIDVTSPSPTGNTCSYPNSGSYTLRLAATDNMNATGIATTTVTVANIAPTYTPDPNQSTAAGVVTPFTLGTFSDPGAEGTWTISINWGDNSASTQFTVSNLGLLPDKSHVFSNAGTYNVVVTVNDDVANVKGGFQVAVNAPPPGAPIVIFPPSQTAKVGVENSFNLGSFTDTGASWQVTVNWGDGSAITLFTMTASGEIPAKPHTYAAPGQYEVFVTVSDGALSAAAIFLVTIPEEPVEEGEANLFLPTARKP